jgi:HTH-type transcriptional regulator / antitoxin HigA
MRVEVSMSFTIDKVLSDVQLDHYFKLVLDFPLRPIRTDQELMQAIAVINTLITRALDDAERDYLDVLSDIVEKYESDERPMPPVSDAEMLRHLIEARDITQTQLAADTSVSNSVISEVLNGRRRLTRKQVSLMAKYFGVSPSVFNLVD